MRIYSSKGNRALSLGLYLLILISFVLYTWVVVDEARETRVGNALDGDQAAAELSARFIDGQWRDIVDTARLLASHKQLGAAVRARDRTKARLSLHAAIRNLPELRSAAVYLRNGELLACDPPAFQAGNAGNAQWYREVAGKRPTYIGWAPPSAADAGRAAAGILVVAVRLDERTPAGGFLLAAVRPKVLTGWLQQFAHMDNVFLVVDSGRKLVAASKGARTDLIAAASMPIRSALQGQSGGTILTEPGNTRRRVLAGYALARLPGWAVLSTQSEATVLNPTYSLAARFAVLLAPMLLVISGVILLLNTMYARQANLTLQLEKQNAQLQQANQIRSDFLANVSHDLRTPLTSMGIALSGLLDTEAAWDRQEARSSIQFVSEEIDLLEARVRNLLEMSRLDAKSQSPTKFPADLTDIVGAAMERLQPMLGSRQLLLHFPDESLLVSCDAAQIETVLLNLLENAVKYAPPGSALRLVGERQPGRALFAVEDRGPGIEPGQEERIFEKFYRAPTNRQAQGTGLGLAICKAIVEAHDGEIGAMNLPDGGARFWFTLQAVLDHGSHPKQGQTQILSDS